MKLSYGICLLLVSPYLLISGTEEQQYLSTKTTKKTKVQSFRNEVKKNLKNRKHVADFCLQPKRKGINISKESYRAVQRDSAGAFLNSTISTKADPRSLYRDCPSTDAIKQLLSSDINAQYIVKVTDEGDKKRNENDGGVLNMCHECYYDVHLSPTITPGILRHVECNNVYCFVANSGKCVSEKIKTNLVQTSANGKKMEFNINVSRSCCCQLKKEYAVLNGK